MFTLVQINSDNFDPWWAILQKISSTFNHRSESATVIRTYKTPHTYFIKRIRALGKQPEKCHLATLDLSSLYTETIRKWE